MERKHKIIIISLVIVIVALAAGLAYMLLGNGFSGEENVPDGMQRYDFDSAFTMLVPDDVRFLKEWNTSFMEGFGQGTSYFDKNNKFSVIYGYSPILTKNFIKGFINLENASGNITFENEGDLIIIHNLNHGGKVAKTLDDSEFKYSILLQRNHEVVTINGNDLDFIKSMANSIKFYSGGD